LPRPPLLNLLLLAFVLALGSAGPSAAQSVQRIAAIVNDDVISAFDLEQRVEMVIRSSRMPDSADMRRRLRRQVLDALIDEKLQLQEARRLNLAVSEAEVDNAIGMVARQNNLSKADFQRFLASNGIPVSAVQEQLKAEVAWAKVVRRRLQPTVNISEEQVDEELERRKRTAGQPQSRLAEIFLPVDSPDLEDEVLRNAERLVGEVGAGADFSALARQFSRTASAPDGGDIGWVRQGQLGDEMDAAIAGLQVGQVSQPIRGTGGYYLVKLVDRRDGQSADPLRTRLALRQLTVPIRNEGGRASVAQVREALAGISGCERIQEATQRLPQAVVDDLGRLRVGELPERLRATLATLPIGTFSEPMADEQNIMALMVCDREEPKVVEPTRDSVSEELVRQRVGVMAYRHLRDLRRSAVIEFR